MNIEVSKPLKLEGTHNTRDLGGYQTLDGKMTKSHKLLRSDAMHSLSEKAKEYLYEYGVRCIIDMRSLQECEKQPCTLMGYKDVDYLQVPMFDNIHSSELKGDFPEDMGQMYIGLMELSAEAVKTIMKSIISHSDNCVVFNCTAGKDRTGTIAMLILLLCKVSEEVILADYGVSRQNLEPIIKPQMDMIKSLGLQVPDYVFDSNPKDMEKVIRYINEKYTCVDNYLEHIGLEKQEIEELRGVLVDE